jgi:hypothetical protein
MPWQPILLFFDIVIAHCNLIYRLLLLSELAGRLGWLLALFLFVLAVVIWWWYIDDGFDHKEVIAVRIPCVQLPKDLVEDFRTNFTSYGRVIPWPFFKVWLKIANHIVELFLENRHLIRFVEKILSRITDECEIKKHATVLFFIVDFDIVHEVFNVDIIAANDVIVYAPVIFFEDVF